MRQLSLHPELIERIVVLRANGLGDFLFATPALRALGAAFPKAEITYLCQPWLHPFLEGRFRYIHRVLTVPPYDGIRVAPTPRPDRGSEAEQFFRDAAQHRYDLAIQMHGGGVQSNPFVQRLGAHWTLGLTGPRVPPLDANLTYQLYQPEVLRYLELVAQIGVEPQGLEMEAPEVPGDLERLRAAWPGLPTGGYVVMNPGASDPRRHWPVERFAAVARQIYRDTGKICVITGSLPERGLAAALREAAGTPVVELTGQLDVGATVALLRRARLVVSNDTGLSNLAYAVHTPAVVIYWCGNLITAGPFTRRYFRPVLSWTLDCPSCGRRDCHCAVSFVQDASLADVLDQVDDLLGTPVVPAGFEPVTIDNDLRGRRRQFDGSSQPEDPRYPAQAPDSTTQA